MIRPDLTELLDGVADSLATTVVPELPVGLARTQVEAAVVVIRRAANAWPRIGAYLHADNEDLAATLVALAPLLARGDDRARGLAPRVGSARREAPVDAPAPAPLDALARANERLQALVVEVLDLVASPGWRNEDDAAAIRRAIHGLVSRSVEREREINGLAWAPTNRGAGG
ncbi:MAG TPA: hypothetical protein VGQ20_08930 [Acidimicrobiales bacterium]|jgi:hypothetical protein|nr:hypothetical protein [Acidimicrobiales bacterium]